MTDSHQLKNAQIRTLVEISPAINSLHEEAAERLFFSINKVDEVAQKELIRIMTEEQQQTLNPGNDDDEMLLLEEMLAQISGLKRSLERVDLKEKEKKEGSDSDELMERILRNMDL